MKDSITIDDIIKRLKETPGESVKETIKNLADNAGDTETCFALIVFLVGGLARGAPDGAFDVCAIVLNTLDRLGALKGWDIPEP